MIRKVSNRLIALSQLVPHAESFRKNPDTNAAVWSMPPDPIVSLLGLKEIDHILKSGAMRVDRVSVVRDGKLIPRNEYGIDTDERASRVSTEQIRRSFQKGDTVVLNGLEECWPALEEMCSRLSFELGVEVWANAYLTPPASQGFSHHYDLHSVLIVQTSGSKTWDLYAPVLADPIEEQGHRDLPQSFWDRDVKEEPYLKVTLNPGDVLWIPRGWIHGGRATNDHSLHVTFGFEPLTPYWLISQILGQLADLPELRSDLPWGIASSPSVLQDIATKALDSLVAAVDGIDWRSFTEKLTRSHKYRDLGKSGLQVLSSEIAAETIVATNRKVIHDVSMTSGGEVVVRTARTSLTIRKSNLENLPILLQREEDEPWCALDLGSDVDHRAAVRTVEDLVRHGVIRVV